jgi:hypothetical protein
MRKPRQVYTEEEIKEIDIAAQGAFERLAGAGIYLPFESCWRLSEMSFLEKDIEQLKENVKNLT